MRIYFETSTYNSLLTKNKYPRAIRDKVIEWAQRTRTDIVFSVMAWEEFAQTPDLHRRTNLFRFAGGICDPIMLGMVQELFVGEIATTLGQHAKTTLFMTREWIKRALRDNLQNVPEEKRGEFRPRNKEMLNVWRDGIRKAKAHPDIKLMESMSIEVFRDQFRNTTFTEWIRFYAGKYITDFSDAATADVARNTPISLDGFAEYWTAMAYANLSSIKKPKLNDNVDLFHAAYMYHVNFFVSADVDFVDIARLSPILKSRVLLLSELIEQYVLPNRSLHTTKPYFRVAL